MPGCALLFALLLGLAPLAAQTQTPSRRPTIGLVLEGGGALGFAHIGVLQWLEDHRIPVDYIAGTSMGGLIGGLYATGQRPSEIRALARDIRWDQTLSGNVAFQDLAFRRKEDRVDYPNRLLFGLKDGFSLPGGLNSGHEIGLILDRAVLPYFNLPSFDDLPIPFRCVATEMVSGTQTIFDRGSLATALRATMSIPAVFSPVKDNGKFYTDGGALNNLPVDVARTMGADIVIAVYLNTGAADPKTFNSLLGVAARNIAIMIAANELRSLEQADILLSADLKGFTSADFGRSEEIVPHGFDAAARKARLLERLALSESDWSAHLAAREARRRPTVPVPQFLAVEGASPILRPAIVSALAPRIGQPVAPDTLDDDLRQLNGLGYFDSLGYNLTARDGQPGLEIRAVEKSYAPPFLSLGINIDGTDTTDIRFGLSARATFMNFAGYRSELRTEGFFGPNNGLQAELFHPLTPSSNWFVAPRLYAIDRNFEVYSDQLRVSQYRIRNLGFGADIGYLLSRHSEIRLGQSLEWQAARLRIGVPLAPNGSNHRGITSARFRYFGQDDAIVPRKGLMFSAGFSYASGRPAGGDGYSSLTAKVAYFQPVSPKGSVFLTATGGSAFGAKGLGGEAFALGGPLSLSAYGRNELLGNQFYLWQGGYIHQVFKLSPLVGDGVYLAGLFELGKVYAPLLPRTPANPMDGTLLVVVKTIFGPVFAGGSIGDTGRRKWWFGVGRVF